MVAVMSTCITDCDHLAAYNSGLTHTDICGAYMHTSIHTCACACKTLACHLQSSIGTADSEPCFIQRELAYLDTLQLDRTCTLRTTACYNLPHFGGVVIMASDVHIVLLECWYLMA